jgi:LysR family glycine cleavage system transcriptional activator
VTPFPLCVSSGAAYYLVYPERTVAPPTLTALVDFLSAEAADSRARLQNYLPITCNAL